MKKTLLRSVILAMALGVTAAADTVIEEIVARVNDAIVTRSEYQRSRDQFRQELRQQFGENSDAEFAKREKDVLRDMIDQRLLVQRGKDLGISVDNELIKRLDEIRKNMNLETMDELEAAAAKQGVSFEDFKENMRESILTQRVIGQEVGSRLQITNQDVQEYYEKHKSELTRPEQVRLSEILVAPQTAKAGEEPTPEQLAAAEAKAKQLLEQVQKGANFEELAKAQSNGPSAAEGGDLGMFQRGSLAKELEDVVFAMKPGQVSDVIQTRQGFIVLKVTEKSEPGVPPLKDVERQIQEAIYVQRLQPAMRQYLTKLREEAFIQVKEGFVDSGASANQQNPVVTAAQSEEKKEEQQKKKKKFLLF